MLLEFAERANASRKSARSDNHNADRMADIFEIVVGVLGVLEQEHQRQ
jgi:hypothetical protein